MIPGSAIWLLLIAGGTYVLIILVIDWSNSTPGLFKQLFEGVGGRIRHRQRVYQWKQVIPSLTKQRVEWEVNRTGRRTARRSVDMIAESLATHQDLLEELYGEVPTTRKVYRRVQERYRN